MNKSIFIQTNYKEDDLNLSRYGCNFLTLCKIAQEHNPIKILKTKEDVLKFAKECQHIYLANGKQLIDSDYFVNSATELLRALTGQEWKQLSVADALAGVGGAKEWIPINYPAPKNAIQIACYRKKDNFKSTHFSQIETTAGETFSSTNVFNTLGEEWLEKNRDLWYASDKRVYLPIKVS